MGECEPLYPLKYGCVFGDCVEGSCECWDGFSSAGAFHWSHGNYCTTHTESLRVFYLVSFYFSVLTLGTYGFAILLKFNQDKAKCKSVLRKVPTILTLFFAAMWSDRRLINFEKGQYVLGRDIWVSVLGFLFGTAIYASGGILLQKYSAYFQKMVYLKGEGNVRRPRYIFNGTQLLLSSAFASLACFCFILASVFSEHETFFMRLSLLMGSAWDLYLTIQLARVFGPPIKDLRTLIEQHKSFEKEGYSMRRAQMSLRRNVMDRNILVLTNFMTFVVDLAGFSLPLFFEFYRYAVPLRLFIGEFNIFATSVLFIRVRLRYGPNHKRRKGVGSTHFQTRGTNVRTSSILPASQSKTSAVSSTNNTSSMKIQPLNSAHSASS